MNKGSANKKPLSDIPAEAVQSKGAVLLRKIGGIWREFNPKTSRDSRFFVKAMPLAWSRSMGAMAPIPRFATLAVARKNVNASLFRAYFGDFKTGFKIRTVSFIHRRLPVLNLPLV